MTEASGAARAEVMSGEPQFSVLGALHYANNIRTAARGVGGVASRGASEITTTSTTTTTTNVTTQSALHGHPLASAPEISLSVREHISQSTGQALEGLGDSLQKNEGGAPAGSVLREVQELSGFSSTTTST